VPKFDKQHKQIGKTPVTGNRYFYLFSCLEVLELFRKILLPMQPKVRDVLVKSCISESTVSPTVVSNEYSTRPVQGDVVRCPPLYESYCLHGGVCSYVSDLQDYACK